MSKTVEAPEAGVNSNPGPPEPITSFGAPIPELLTSGDHSAAEAERPGAYPFTRGIFPTGYRDKLWTIRQYSGFGTAEQTNERYRFLLGGGTTGLSVALDLPTQCGYDPDDPMAAGEVGKVGVSLFSLAEAEILFAGLDIGRISTSFTINGTAAIVYAMYVATADKLGVPRARLTGTLQNDILKEYVARGTWIFPVRPSMRLVSDTILYSNKETPRFNPISIAGAHVRDAGATAAEEMGYTLANGLAYVDELLRRGGDINDFARRLSFFFYVHMDFFEEIAKFRAGRRLWAKMLRTRYSIEDERALMFRFGVVCGGSSLTAQQPHNNISRVAIETMAAVMGGAQSIFTCAFDEALQLPSPFSAEIALRTQQVIAYETGITKTVDPLGGAHYLEWLTDRMEAEVAGIMAELEAYGGVEKAITDGLLQARIGRRAFERKVNKDRGAAVVVGDNYFRSAVDNGSSLETVRSDPTVEASVKEKLRILRQTRNQVEVEAVLNRLENAANRDHENIMPYIVDCCHAYATVGEMVARLRKCWGEFREPIQF